MQIKYVLNLFKVNLKNDANNPMTKKHFKILKPQSNKQIDDIRNFDNIYK